LSSFRTGNLRARSGIYIRDWIGETAAGRFGTLKIWQLSCVVSALTATPLAAMHQIAASRPSAAAPSAIVAEAFSAMSLNTTTVLAKVRVPPPTRVTDKKLTLSASAIIAAEFSAATPEAVASSDVTGSLTQGRVLLAYAGPDAVPPQHSSLQQDRTPAASAGPAGRELPLLRDYAYSEVPPPEKPAKIALAALSDVPLGTPVEEIKRAADAFGLDANFMKAVAKIESDFDPKERTGSYIGLFQLSDAEFREYGSGDIRNARDNAIAAADKFVTEATLFELMTHKKPTFSDLYLIHQQGWEGAAEHVSHPQQLAWKSMCATDEGMAKGERWCKRAIWGNTLPAVKREWKSVDRLTSGAFVAMWQDRIAALYARYAGADATVAQAQSKPADAQP
jgi:soluble lytic murein transglycosylase-like protein